MIWDVPHHRGTGFSLTILRPAWVHPVLTCLVAVPGQRPSRLLNSLEEANAAYGPLVGSRDLSEKKLGDALGYLREAGLAVRYAGDGAGAHTRYEATEIGVGLIRALGPIRSWAVADFDFVVAATRVRMGLPPLTEPIIDGLRKPAAAENLALGLLSGVWADTVMVYVDSAGTKGISALRLEEVVNAAIDASSGPDQVMKHLHRKTLYRHLHRLVAKGLLERREQDPHVLYRLTTHGRGLLDAWWQVAEGWSMAHDAELFEIMAKTTTWFPNASAD